jgi:hypothetical protein
VTVTYIMKASRHLHEQRIHAAGGNGGRWCVALDENPRGSGLCRGEVHPAL